MKKVLSIVAASAMLAIVACGPSAEEKKRNYEYQIRNMYDEEKHVNPHDIAGQKGMVKV